MSSHLVSFEEVAAHPEVRGRIGRKAGSLVDLVLWGLPVPPGAVVTADALERFLAENGLAGRAAESLARRATDAPPDAARLAALRDAILAAPFPADLGGALAAWRARRPSAAVAVRSSGLCEDLANASFAGQYLTILDVEGEEALLRAVRECWASLFTPNVIGYARDRGIDASAMRLAVIVQEMIPAEKSGVVFTVNPVTGVDREMVIEACPGLGDALVSGAVTPDRYRYDWYRDEEVERVVAERPAVTAPPDAAAVLAPSEVRQLAALALDIQTRCGFPVDVEWARRGDAFFILQSRPITSIGVAGIDGEWTTADFRDGGVSSTVCTPFMWSLYDLVWERALPDYAKRVRLLDHDPGIVWGEMFYGRPYWNSGAIKACLERLPGFVERAYDEDLGIEVSYEGDGFVSRTTARTALRAVRVLAALRRSVRHQRASIPGFREREVSRLRTLEAIVPATLPREALFEAYERLILDDYRLVESAYFTLIFHNSNLQSLFRDAIRKGPDAPNLGALLGGLGRLSHMLPIFRLWRLSRQMRRDAEARDFVAATPAATLSERLVRGDRGPCLDMLRDVVGEFRYRAPRELDLTVPRYGEDPTPVIENLKRFLELEDDQDPEVANERQRAAFLRERERFLAAVPWYRRRSLSRGLEEVRWFLWWREELRDLSTRMYARIRTFTLAVATHLVQEGVLGDAAEIFMLPVTSLLEVLRGGVGSEELAALVRRNRRYHDSFRNFENPDDLGSRPRGGAARTPGPGRALAGVPCSPGVASGRARVIEDIWDARRLAQGDILVTRFTDPAWTPSFGLLRGVATETGGLLSHAAVIAREYGIPAVLAVKGLTRAVRDGSPIEIDGSRGTVTPLDGRGSAE